ncbi:MAG: glycosyl hydrolase [Bacteroidetes bacterium]|nr:glycosyl hydrolase [Bacteroidota bacterium]
MLKYSVLHMGKYWVYLIITCFLFQGFNLRAQEKTKLNKYTFGAVKARHIGPATMSGRISALDAVKNDSRIVYVGSASGGVWKSKNAGTTFKAVFDKYNQSVGAIAIDQKHPDTVWVGTGEVWVRNSTSVGDGIYKTRDGGENWQKMGLEDTERISRIVIHPDDTDVVYVAALGHLWNANSERGVYKTTDGGKNWEKILFVDENTGCADLAMDPEDPDILYAGMWDFRRKPYCFRSGGPGSGFYKSTDGGTSWKKLEKDLPETELGRIAVAASPADTDIVWALIETEKSGLFRSADKGESWELMTTDPVVGKRPFYFSLIVPDPVDTNRIYKPGFTLNVSNNGGKTFSTPFVGGGRVHSDIHALWISDKDNNFMYLGTDGGLYISHDRGNTWKFCRNLPISQFYHVSVDNKNPYWVYGGLQDNGSWMAPSKSPGGIQNRNWENVGYGDGFNVFCDRYDDNIIYWQYQGGNIKRRYKDTWEVKDIKPYADKDVEELRFNWDAPIVQSPTQKTIYVGAQYLFKSDNRGDTWERISPDLSTNDLDKLRQEETGGLTIDNSTAENHCTIFAIAESPVENNVIWAGTDDGNLQITLDGGQNWNNIVTNISGLPPNTWCSCIEPGKFKKGKAYVTFDGHREGDKNPYVFVTEDYGQTWENIADETIPIYCHVIREDTENPDLLFLGTEYGLYISIDQGDSWVPFSGNLPKVAIRDMELQTREHDLVLATHGRGIVIIDDLTPIRHLTTELIAEDFAFLEARPYKLGYLGYQGGTTGDDEYIGDNPAGFVLITYYLKKRHIFGDMFIEVYDQEDNLLKTLPAGKRKGINRVPWRIKMKPPKVPSSIQILGQVIYGPTYPPGDYKVKIIKGDDVYEGLVSVIYDPDSPHSVKDRDLRHEILMKSYKMLEELAFIDRQTIDIRDKTKERAETGKLNKSLIKKLKALSEKADEMRKELLATREGSLTGEKRLRERIGNIYSNVMGYQGRPTDSQIIRLENLKSQMREFEEKVDKIILDDLARINKSLKRTGADEICIITYAEFIKETE